MSGLSWGARRVLGPLALVAAAGCIYLVDRGPLDGLAGGDLAGRAVGVAPGSLDPPPTPLGGVTVTLLGTPRRVTTSAVGRFTLRNLAAGQHVLRLSLDQDNLPPADRVLDVPFNLPTRNGQRAAMDLGDLQLLPPGRVRSSVTVTGPGNAAQARVVLVAASSSMPVGRSVPVDAQGGVQVVGVGQGLWRLTAALGTATAVSQEFRVTPDGETVVPPLVLDTGAPLSPATLQAVLVDLPDVDLRPNVVVDLVPAAGSVGLTPLQVARTWEGDERFALGILGLGAGGPYDVSFTFPDAPEVVAVVIPDVVLVPGVNDLGDIFLTALEDCGACAVSGSSSSSGGPPRLDVTPRYGAVRLFNHWLDEALTVDCVPTATTAHGDCHHVGYKRTVELPAAITTTCADVTASDSAGALLWECEEGTPVRVTSMAFAFERGLRDLLDWSGTPAWRQDMVLTVSINDQVVATSNPGQWWDDPVVDFTGTNAPAMGPAVLAMTALPAAVTVANLDRVAITTPPGQLAGAGRLTLQILNRFFIEANLRQTAGPQALVLLANSSVGQFHNVVLEGPGRALVVSQVNALEVDSLGITSGAASAIQMVHLQQLTASLLGSVTIHGTAVTPGDCLALDEPSRLALLDVKLAGCAVGLSVFNPRTGTPEYTVWGRELKIQNTQNQGILATNMPDMLLDDVRLANTGLASPQAAVQLDGCSRPVLLNLGISNSSQHGLVLNNVSGGVVRGLYAVHNDGQGVRLALSTNMFLGEVTAAYNRQANVSVDNGTAVTLSRVLVFGGWQGLLTQSGDITVHHLQAVGNSVLDVSLDGTTAEFRDTFQAGTCASANGATGFQGTTTCATTLTTRPILNAPLFPMVTADEGTGQQLFDTAANLTTAKLWTASESPSRAWAPDTTLVGRCTTNCALVDYALRTPADDTTSTVPTGSHTWDGAQEPQCTALGGLFSTMCRTRHAVDFVPVPGTPPSGARGLCANGLSNPVDCTAATWVGAYQGSGARTPGPMLMSGTVNIQQWTHSIGLLP